MINLFFLEGFGPLIFGSLMALFEDAPLPGAPYLLAAMIALWSFVHTFELPDEPTIVKVDNVELNVTHSISASKKDLETISLLNNGYDTDDIED